MTNSIGPKLLVATHNKGKMEEILTLLAPHGIEVVSAADFGLTEPEETEDNFVGNARIKAHYAAKATGLPTLADDSGICVDALSGAPGVYTADWAETPNGRNFSLAMTKVWDACEELEAEDPRLAKFCSTLVLAFPDGTDKVFEGTISGRLVWPPRGAEGHGYDPMFMPSGYDVTFAQMTLEVKNRISHRADAFRKFIAECFT